ncbi:MAG: hypothetical protein IJH91_03235 [Mogibacterium sp.]|nr:hypothetical protein [Mogibacterium sp.]
MSLRKRIGKKGSYIVEAVLTIPVFLIAVIVMLSIITLYADIEESNYVLANEMRKEAIRTEFITGEFFFSGTTANRIQKASPHIRKLTINDYLYREQYLQIDEVLFLEYDTQLHVDNPLGLLTDAKYKLALMTRAYVGKWRDIDPMSDDDLAGDDSDPVYVFPKMGRRYHVKSCTYVRSAYVTVPLTNALRSKYAPCSVCHSGNAALGTSVCYFPEYGDAYHLKGCRVLSRDYIEMERSTAVERGYTPCTKCGG